MTIEAIEECAGCDCCNLTDGSDKCHSVCQRWHLFPDLLILAILVDKPSDKALVLDILDVNARQLEPQAVPVALSHQICNLEKNLTD